MELQITTELVEVLPKEIDFNYEEIKAELKKKTAYYNTLTVTEENLKESKSDKAWLNNLAKTLNDKRIEQQRLYMKPFDNFKTKIDELINLVKEPSNQIDNQIKTFDETKKQEKFDKITQFYNENIGDLITVLPLVKILNPKWANAAIKLDSINQEVIDKIMTVKNDFKVIETMKLSCECQMKDAYLRNLSMSDALEEKHRFEEQQAKLEAIKKSEQHTQKQPCRAVCTQEEHDICSEEECHGNCGNDIKQQEETKTIKVVFYDTTQEFRHEMKTLTTKYGIKYGGIK